MIVALTVGATVAEAIAQWGSIPHRNRRNIRPPGYGSCARASNTGVTDGSTKAPAVGVSGWRSVAPSRRHSSPPDGTVVDHALAGDSFVTLLKRHDDLLRVLAARLLVGLPDQVDDVLQDAYVRAFRAFPRFRHDADVGTWLYRITYNACIDELRRAGRRPAPIDPADAVALAAVGADPSAAVSAIDLAVRALASLPSEQRAAVVLIDGEGFDVHAAAEFIGVPVGTVASRVSRGRAHIRRLIGKDEP